MGFLWLLNLALLFVFETSLGGARGGDASISANAHIPGCGDPETTPAPEEDQPTYYALYKDAEGCKVKIIGTWMTTVDYQRLSHALQQARGSSGKVKLPASCKKTCGKTVKNLKEGTPCRKVLGRRITKRTHIKHGCFVGHCQNGLCVSDDRKTSCYIPPNITNPIPTHGPLAE
uniref:Evasin n=1 Tax=Amblyomma cajennense TaxID=34607 RepID=A0A023FTP2_AMBCJ